jgi:hypothetical protein
MITVLVRHFSGSLHGVEHILMLTAGITTPPEALEVMTTYGVKALEHKFPGITGAAPVNDHWSEYELPDEDED